MSPFNRRQFIKGGLAGGAALLVPVVLKGARITKSVNPKCNLTTVSTFNEERHAAKLMASFDSVREQKRECFDKWSKVFAFNGLTEDDAIELAVCLENQRLFNEVVTDTNYSDDRRLSVLKRRSNDIAQFKRISIPLTYRGFLNSASKEWVSHQAMMGPCDMVFWNYPLVNSEEIIARTRKCKTVCPSYEDWVKDANVYGINAEAELCAVLAQELTIENDREVATDLKNNARKFVSHSKNVVSFIDGRFKFDLPAGDNYYETKECVEHPYLAGLRGNRARSGVSKLVVAHKMCRWAVTSPEICNEIEAHKDFIPIVEKVYNFGIRAIGYIHYWKVFKDPLFPTRQALIGCKFGHYNTGYIMSNYMVFRFAHLVLIRYAKKLVDSKMYGNIIFKS